MAAGFLFAAGLALQAYGQAKQNKAERESLLEQARNRDIAANELMERFEINKKQIIKESQRAQGQVGLAAAKGMVDISSGSPLQLMGNIMGDYLDEIEFQRRDTEYKASALRAGASISRSQERKVKKAGTIGLISTGFMGAAQIAKD